MKQDIGEVLVALERIDSALRAMDVPMAHLQHSLDIAKQELDDLRNLSKRSEPHTEVSSPVGTE